MAKKKHPSLWTAPPIYIGLALALATAFPLSGVLRFYTALSLESALKFLYPLLAFGFYFVAGKKLFPKRVLPPAMPVAIVSVVLFLATTVALHNSFFDSYPSAGGVDAGNHIVYKHRFTASDPHAYYGFNVHYALAYWLEKFFSIDEFDSFRALFYLTLAYLIVFAGQAFRLVGVGGINARPRRFAGLFALVFFGGILPVLSYHQSNGFIAHVFGLTVLLGLWFWFAAVDSPRVRWPVAAAALVVFRHTYALNLGDVCAALGALAVWERKNSPAREKNFLAGTAGFFALAAFVSYRRLSGVLGLGGDLVPLNLIGIFAALPAGLVLLNGPRREAKAPSTQRFYAFALVFIGVSGAALTVALLAVGSAPYYLQKYSLYAQVVLLLAATIAIANAGRKRLGARDAFGIAFVAIALGYANANYYPYFFERVAGHPPWRYLEPYVDREALARIRGIAAAANKPISIVLAPQVGELVFTNGLLDFDYFVRRADYPEIVVGKCAFWFNQPGIEDRYRFASRDLVRQLSVPFSVFDLYAALNRDPGRTCVAVTLKAAPDLPTDLCHVCR